MFDNLLIHSASIPVGRTERTPSAMPWQLVALLLGLAALSVVAALLFPAVFAAPLEHF